MQKTRPNHGAAPMAQQTGGSSRLDAPSPSFREIRPQGEEGLLHRWDRKSTERWGVEGTETNLTWATMREAAHKQGTWFGRTKSGKLGRNWYLKVGVPLFAASLVIEAGLVHAATGTWGLRTWDFSGWHPLGMVELTYLAPAWLWAAGHINNLLEFGGILYTSVGLVGTALDFVYFRVLKRGEQK